MLAGRIAYLVEHRGVPAATILAITFTTAAAATLRQRLLGVLGDAAHDLTITTFHALGLRLIKQWSGELGFGDGVPAVYGRDDARVLLREVASVLGLEVAPEARGREIDPWALSLSKLTLALDRFRLGWNDRGRSSEEHDDIDEELLRQLTKAYEAQLQQRGAVDFPSMLTLPLHLFESEPGAIGARSAARRPGRLSLCYGRRISGHVRHRIQVASPGCRTPPEPGGGRRSKSSSLWVSRCRSERTARLPSAVPRSTRISAGPEPPVNGCRRRVEQCSRGSTPEWP